MSQLQTIGLKSKDTESNQGKWAVISGQWAEWPD